MNIPVPLAVRHKSKIILLCLGCFLLITLNYSNLLSTLLYKIQRKVTESTTKAIWKNVDKDIINDIEILTLLPSSSPNEIKGAVLLLHGCNHDGIDWFQLPEEQTIVNHILSLSLAAIAISSPNRSGSRCWDSKLPPNENSDVKKVSQALNEYFELNLPIMQKQQHQNNTNIEIMHSTSNKSYLPLYAIGASSGGSFIPILHHQIALDGMICQISLSPLFRTMEQIPPTVLIYMVHDSHANERTVSSMIQEIQSKGENEQQRPLIKSFACHPKPVTSKHLMNRIPNLSSEDAEGIKDLLPLDEEGFLSSNPRSIWSRIVHKEPISGMDTITQLSIIEELNVAFAQHELTSDFVENAMEFISSTNFIESV